MSNTLFSQSFLEAGLRETPEYQQISPDFLSRFRQNLRVPYDDLVGNYQDPNEAQTEDALIRPVLDLLGWNYLPQEPIPGGSKVPDYTLFVSKEDQAAFTGTGDVSVYPLAPAEAKAWRTNLDQGSGRQSPNGQIQEYMKEYWQVTKGRVRWGILTDGETWRLYRAVGPGPDGKFYQTQDSWFEINLSDCVGDGGQEQRRQLRLFFHRDSFRIGSDGYCFLDRALSEAANYVQTVVETLTNAVFEDVYPQLLSAFFHARSRRKS